MQSKADKTRIEYIVRGVDALCQVSQENNNVESDVKKICKIETDDTDGDIKDSIYNGINNLGVGLLSVVKQLVTKAILELDGYTEKDLALSEDALQAFKKLIKLPKESRMTLATMVAWFGYYYGLKKDNGDILNNSIGIDSKHFTKLLNLLAVGGKVADKTNFFWYLQALFSVVLISVSKEKVEFNFIRNVEKWLAFCQLVNTKKEELLENQHPDPVVVEEGSSNPVEDHQNQKMSTIKSEFHEKLKLMPTQRPNLRFMTNMHDFFGCLPSKNDEYYKKNLSSLLTTLNRLDTKDLSIDELRLNDDVELLKCSTAIEYLKENTNENYSCLQDKLNILVRKYLKDEIPLKAVEGFESKFKPISDNFRTWSP